MILSSISYLIESAIDNQIIYYLYSFFCRGLLEDSVLLSSFTYYHKYHHIDITLLTNI